MKKAILLFVLSLAYHGMCAQFSFSGKIDEENKEGNIYLSVIEDYRKNFWGIPRTNP